MKLNLPETTVELIQALREENERLSNELERERIRLAACGVAAMQNTENSKADRIDESNPYWSASYGDVLRAVDSEIALRQELKKTLEFAVGQTIVTPEDLLKLTGEILILRKERDELKQADAENAILFRSTIQERDAYREALERLKISVNNSRPIDTMSFIMRVLAKYKGEKT